MRREPYKTTKHKSTHLNAAERKIIECMLREGVNKTQTSKALKRNISTIKREIKRGSVIQRRENPYASRNKNVPDYPEEKVYFGDVGQRGYEKKDKTSVPETRLQSAVKWRTL